MNLEATAAARVPQLLSDWLGETVEAEGQVVGGAGAFEFVVRGGDVAFVVEVRRDDRISVVEAAGRQAGRHDSGGDAVAVLTVPFMGPKAREYARTIGLSWMDLSGNADIRGRGIRILVEGKPNRFASPGRPSTAFSDKAARISRAMLVEPERWWQQRELATALDVSTGYVSKVVGRLVDDELLERDPDGRLRPSSPGLLLDAWAQVYDFRRHEITRFHAVGRTGPSTATVLAGRLASARRLDWAATGLAAAWALTHHVDHRLATFFVSRPLLDPEEVGLRPVEAGENVWLVVPRDEGVFYAAKDVSGLRCVHPVQVYLDLLGHPERAREAMVHLRDTELGWSGA